MIDANVHPRRPPPGCRVETPGLVDWGLIESARDYPPGERLLDGGRLFDLAVSISKDGIRMQNPSANEDEVHRMLLERLALGERNENLNRAK